MWQEMDHTIVRWSLQTKAPWVRLPRNTRLYCAGIGEDATAMGDEATAALAALTAEVAGLRQSLALMLETQATHSEMLRRLLEAAAAPAEPENRLADALAQIAATLRDQGRQIEAVEAILRQLPVDVGQAVGRGVRDALSEA